MTEQFTDTKPKTTSQVTRRDFLKFSSVLALLTTPACRWLVSETSELKPIKSQVNEVGINLGREEYLEMPGLNFYPDGHLSFIRNQDEYQFWIPAETHGYYATGNSFDDLKLHPNPVLGPSEAEYENGYASFGSVHQGNTPQEKVGFYHAEKHASTYANFTASICSATSTNNGIDWNRQGQIIQGYNAEEPGKRVSGAGQPCAIEKDGYYYLYFVDWNGQQADSIHLARSPISSKGQPGTWEKYTENGFQNVGPQGKSIAIIQPPGNPNDTVYAALPSISYNQHLKKYTGVFETSNGFWLSLSDDAIDWTSAQQVCSFPQPQISRNKGDIWYSYPSMLSPKTDNHTITEKQGYLYYSSGVWQEKPHRMYRRSFNIE